MKRTYKSLTHTGFIAVLCLFLAIPAMAQHRGGGGGGGGHSSGGGGGGGRSSGSFSGGSRGSAGVSSRATNITSQRTVSGQRTSVSRGSIGYTTGSRGIVRTNAVGAGGHRGYVAGSVGAGVYGHGGNYGRYGWGNHGGYFYHGGFYGSLYYPFLGLGYGFLPYGYYSFYWGGYPYYFSDGLYYQYNNDQYTVVEPPVGASVNTLPSKAQSIVIDGQQYYELNGVYYSPITKDDGTTAYEVVGKDGQLNTGATGAASVMPKIGDIVGQLPADCKKVKLNGSTFYVSVDGIYYQEAKDDNGNKVYKIVAMDAADATGN